RGKRGAARGKLTRDGNVLATPTHIEITPRCERFNHDDACVVARTAAVGDDTQMVVIDLRFAREVTTAAFARLVLLRRRLRSQGRDLLLTNLGQRAAGLYHINRLATVLPCG